MELRDPEQVAAYEHMVDVRWNAVVLRGSAAALRVRARGLRLAPHVTGTRGTRRVIAGGSDVSHDGSSQRPVVLVVDDHADTREMYAQFLDVMGFAVLQASTCAAALEKAAATRVDAVVLDRKLPDGDGMKVCQTLKSDPRTSGLPVVVLSGRAQDDELGADAYFMKPVLPEMLAAELARLIASRDGHGHH
jgi:CheY-like chemotaxis protein